MPPRMRLHRPRESSVLVLGTRGLKARHRHLMRDVLRLLPHGVPGSKLDTEDNSLLGAVSACEDANCGTALLFDARDPRRLFLWAASCPNGPSAMFRVRNVHTASELNLEARRCGGVRNLLAFDRAFEASADRRLLKALLTRALGVPRGAAKRVVAAAKGGAPAAEEGEGGSDEEEEVPEDDEDEDGGSDEEQDEVDAAKDRDATLDRLGMAAAPRKRRRASAATPSGSVERVKHALSFSWVDERIWLRVYRIGPDSVTGALDVVEIGPRLVLEPVRIIASAFAGAVLHTHTSSRSEMLDEDEWR